MGKAIGINLKKNPALGEAKSKFFGSPLLPQDMIDTFLETLDDSTLFLCQIDLKDTASLDRGNKLPHEGTVYVFLDTASGKYNLKPIVIYATGEPNVAIDSFNEGVPGFESYVEPLEMSFVEVEEDADCTRLLGVPSDWNYAEPAPELFLQLDPYDETLNFLSELDGFIYLFFGEGEQRFAGMTIKEEYA